MGDHSVVFVGRTDKCAIYGCPRTICTGGYLCITHYLDRNKKGKLDHKYKIPGLPSERLALFQELIRYIMSLKNDDPSLEDLAFIGKVAVKYFKEQRVFNHWTAVMTYVNEMLWPFRRSAEMQLQRTMAKAEITRLVPYEAAILDIKPTGKFKAEILVEIDTEKQQDNTPLKARMNVPIPDVVNTVKAAMMYGADTFLLLVDTRKPIKPIVHAYAQDRGARRISSIKGEDKRQMMEDAALAAQTPKKRGRPRKAPL
jgi:hypothetical protein